MHIIAEQTLIGELQTGIYNQSFLKPTDKISTIQVRTRIGAGLRVNIVRDKHNINFLVMRNTRVNSVKPESLYTLTDLASLRTYESDKLNYEDDGITRHVYDLLNESEQQADDSMLETAEQRFQHWARTFSHTKMTRLLDTSIGNVGNVIIADALNERFNQSGDPRLHVDVTVRPSSANDVIGRLDILVECNTSDYIITYLKRLPSFSISRHFNDDLSEQDEIVLRDNVMHVNDFLKITDVVNELERIVFKIIDIMKNDKDSKILEIGSTDEKALLIKHATYLSEKRHLVSEGTMRFNRVLNRNINAYMALVFKHEYPEFDGRVYRNSHRLYITTKNNEPIASFTTEKIDGEYVIQESYSNRTFELRSIVDSDYVGLLDDFVLETIKIYKSAPDNYNRLVETANQIIHHANENKVSSAYLTEAQSELLRRILYLNKAQLNVQSLTIEGSSVFTIECARDFSFAVHVRLFGQSSRPLSVSLTTVDGGVTYKKSRLNSVERLIRLLQEFIPAQMAIHEKQKSIDDALNARDNSVTIHSLRSNDSVTFSVPELKAFMEQERMTADTIIINTTDEIVKKAVFFKKNFQK